MRTPEDLKEAAELLSAMSVIRFQTGDMPAVSIYESASMAMRWAAGEPEPMLDKLLADIRETAMAGAAIVAGMEIEEIKNVH